MTGLVNCAGVGIAKRFVDTTADDLRRMFEINLDRQLRRRAGRRPCAAGRGAEGFDRQPRRRPRASSGNLERTAYGSAKGAVIVMTQVMAVELAADGIRVNAVSPGPVATPLVDAIHTDAMRERWTALTPLRRYAEPREIAEAIAFLLDEEKASYVTGHVLNVDGGLMSAGLADA